MHLILLLLPLCTWGLESETPKVKPSDHPVTFTPVGDVISSGSHYNVPVRLDIDSLLARIEPLEIALTNTSKHFDSLQTLMGEGNSQANFTSKPRHVTANLHLRHFPSSLRNHIALLIADLHQRVQNLRDVLTSLADFGLPQAPAMLRSRLRRGLVDGIGVGLHYLFGVIDAQTYQEAKDLLDELQDMSERERDQLNIHSRVLNLTTVHINRLEENQNKAQEAITHLDSNLLVLSKALKEQQEGIFELSNALNMVSAISYAGSAIADMTYEYNRFANGLATMVKGTLASEIIPSTNLASLITELNLRNTRTLWPPAPEYLPLYYRFSQVVCLNYKDFTFFVLIPLLPKNNAQLKLFEVSALPYPLNDNITISYGEMSPYLAISEDNQFFMSLTDIDLASCRRFASLHYCDMPRPLLRNSAPTCEYAFFTGLNIASSCEKHVGPRLRHPIITRTPSSWLYATSTAFSLTIICPTGTRTIPVEIGVGMIDLPSKCHASSSFALLPTTLALERKVVEVINFTAIRPFELDLTLEEKKVIETFSVDKLYQDILAFNGQEIPHSSLNNELGQLRFIQRSRSMAYSYSISATGISITLAIIILFSCCGFVYGYRILAGHRVNIFGRVFNEAPNPRGLIPEAILHPTHDAEEIPLHNIRIPH